MANYSEIKICREKPSTVIRMNRKEEIQERDNRTVQIVRTIKDSATEPPLPLGVFVPVMGVLNVLRGCSRHAIYQ